MDHMINVKIKLLPGGRMPTKGSQFAAAWDLRAVGDHYILGGHTLLVPCGFEMEMPEDCAAFIQPRSGLALYDYITVANTPGLIDSDYRGEVKVLLRNERHCAPPFFGSFEIKDGDRIAQMIIKRIEPSDLVLAEELSETDRGTGGFGSSGMK
jgi:dUTP pyrophosphatase